MIFVSPLARRIVERVNRFYADKCPIYRTLKNSIEITTSVELVSADA